MKLNKIIGKGLPLKGHKFYMLLSTLCFCNCLFGQNQHVTINVKNQPLVKVFESIEAQTDLSIAYNQSKLNITQKTNANFNNKTVANVLDVILKGTGFTYRIENKHVIIVPVEKEIKTNISTAQGHQNIKVKGIVTDAKGEPVIGATVREKGTTNGTITDFDGKFELLIKKGSSIEVSYIGYQSQQLLADANKSLNIILKEDTKILDEVVVVGYGTQKKESLTGAMQVVKQEKLIDITTSSAENLLSSKAPGVYVNSGSGQPGSTGKIVIRGKATVNGGTDPLWVIDGVLVGSGAGNLNPSDIESISVLKDAASTAIYGSMGANGVIVVTTKKGKSGETKVNLSARTGISQLNKGGFSVMNGAELYDLYKSFSNQENIQFSQYDPSLRNKDFSWWNAATQIGLVQDYNISVSGGSDKIKSYISLGLYDESGAIKGFDLTKYNFRFNVDYQVNKWLKIKPSVWGARRDIYNKQHSVSAMYRCLIG